MMMSIFHAGSFAVRSVVLAMTCGLGLGLAIALIYKLGTDRPGGFTVVLAVLPMLVTAIIMIVNGNLGVSVAVLGAFGLIRFRSAAGTAREIGFLFFAMAVGLAVGLGFITLALFITALVGLTLVVLEKADFGGKESKARELSITIPEDLNYVGIFDDLFAQYARKARLERVRTTNMGTLYELNYRLELQDPKQEKAFIDALRCRNGNLNISLGVVQREKNEL